MNKKEDNTSALTLAQHNTGNIVMFKDMWIATIGNPNILPVYIDTFLHQY